MKKIGIEDLFREIDLFKKIRESAEQTIVKLNQMHESSVKVAQALQSAVGSNKMNSSKAINDLNKAQEQSNKLMLEAIKIENLKKQAQTNSLKVTQQIEKLEQEYQKRLQQTAKTTQQVAKSEQERIKIEQQQARLNSQLAKEEERKEKAQKKAEETARRQSSAYSQLARMTSDLKNKSKDLASQMLSLEMKGRKHSAEYQNLSMKYKIVTAEAQKFDQKLKQIDKSVGDNFRNVGNYSGAISKLQGVFGAFGIGMGIAPLIQNVTGAVMDFEVQNSRLASVLGTTTSQTRELQAVQRELGRGTAFTAGEVGQLQVELAKLGFTTPEILNSSEAVLKLAGATGSELARASEVAGSTLRGFGLDASNMTHVADVMAKSFSTSALDMESFAESMKYVAPIAKLAGFSIEETSAMLGVLANQGVKGSQAGTSLRRIFTDMARTGKPAKEALAEVTKNGIDVVDAFDEVGRTAMTSLAILGNNTQKVEELSQAYKDADGSVNQMYSTMTDNLQGAVDRLSSAWESYWLDTNETTGASVTLKNALDFLANNLVTIMNLVVRAVRMWVTYKTTMFAVNTINRVASMNFALMGRNIMAMIPFTKAYRIAQVQSARATHAMTIATNTANASQKALKTTMMSTPWGLIAMAVVELALALSSMSDESIQAQIDSDGLTDAQREQAKATEEAKQQQEEENDAVAQASAEFVGLIEQLRNTNANSKERINLINQINSQYGTTLKNLSDETAFQQQLNAVVHEYIEFQRIRYKLESNQKKITAELKKQEEIEQKIANLGKNNLIIGKLNLKQRDDLIKAAKGDTEARGRTINLLASMYKDQIIDRSFEKKVLDDLTNQYNTLTGALNTSNNVLTIYGGKTLDLQSQMKKYNFKDPTKNVNQFSGKTGGGGLLGASNNAKKFETALKDLNEYLSETARLLQELNVIEQERTIDALTKDIDKIVSDAQEKAKKGSKIVLGVELQEPQYDTAGNVVGDEDAIRESNLQKLIASNTTLNQKIEERGNLQKENLKQRASFEKEQLLAEMNKKIEEDRNKLLEEKIKLQAQEGITKADIDKIETDYLAKFEELKQQELKLEEDTKLKMRIIDEKFADNSVKIDKETTEAKKDENEKLLKNWEDVNAKKRDKQKKADEDEIEKVKKREQAIQEIIEASANYFIKRSEEKIAQLEKEIAKAEENQTALQELANNGNIQAKQSLAENQKIIDEANKKKLQEQKKQEKIKLVESALSTYSQKVESGSKSPLADTIKDITLLTQFINTLPAFYDGTEDTGANGHGVDGRGGFHAILHPNERVIPKALNEQIGNLSNEQLTKIASEYQNGKIFLKSDSQIGSAMDTAILVQKLDNLTKVIENKPEHHFEIGQITQTFFEMIEKTKKGNTTIFNKYKVKR